MHADLEDDTCRVRQLRETLEEEQAALETASAGMKAEWEHMQQALTSELAAERETLKRLQDAADSERRENAKRRQGLDAEYQERLHQLEETLNAERQAMRDRIRKEFDTEFGQLNRERQEWSERCREEQNQLREESENLQQQRELLGEQIESEQARLREDMEKRRSVLLVEQTNLQRRYRFQFEHLSRSRNDFEHEVREFRSEQQQFRAERGRFQEQHRLRFSQLQHIRKILSQREASLTREMRVIERSRTAVEMDLARQKERVCEHRDAVHGDMQERTQLMRLKEESIAESNQRIAEKTLHLNRLRAELDAQQRDLLELRIILEEFQAGLNRDNPDVDHEARRQQVRDSLQQFFDDLHRRIHEDLQELERQAAKLESQRAEFRADREQLEQWIVEHQAALRTSSADAPTQNRELEALQSELDQLRQKQAAEQIRAEARIRTLLEELLVLRNALIEKTMRIDDNEESPRLHTPDAA